MVYHDLLKSGEMIKAVRYEQQFIEETDPSIEKKRPEYAKRHNKIILLHDNTRPRVAEPVKNIYAGHELGSLTSSAIFTGHSAI